MRKAVLALTLASALLVECQKEAHVLQEQNTAKATLSPTESAYLDDISAGRKSVATVVTACLDDADFHDAILQGFSAMRTGDSEILFAEMICNDNATRSGNAWNSTAYRVFKEKYQQSSSKVRGDADADIAQFVQHLLEQDPLLQILFVAPDVYDEPNKEMLLDPELLIVPLPDNYTDDEEFSLLAYKRDGSTLHISSTAPPRYRSLSLDRVNELPCCHKLKQKQ